MAQYRDIPVSHTPHPLSKRERERERERGEEEKG